MTSSTGGGGSWPFERVEGDGTPAYGGGFGRFADTPDRPVASNTFAGPAPAEHASGGGGGGRGGRDAGAPKRRRPPLWLLIVIGLVVVGGVVALILALTAKDEAPEVLPAATVTLPVPTPTVDPIAREEGTAFQAALPSTVLDYALTEIVAYEPMLASGAVEAWQLGYTDGAQSVVLYAGQFADAVTAEAGFDQVLAANPVAATDDTATDTSTDTEADDTTATDAATDAATPEPVLTPEQGIVEVDGAQVGRFLFLPREDGTGSLWWTNTTVLFQLDGPATELRDIFAAYSL